MRVHNFEAIPPKFAIKFVQMCGKRRNLSKFVDVLFVKLEFPRYPGLMSKIPTFWLTKQHQTTFLGHKLRLRYVGIVVYSGIEWYRMV